MLASLNFKISYFIVAYCQLRKPQGRPEARTFVGGEGGEIGGGLLRESATGAIMEAA